MNLRYVGIIGETRGESQHTAWTANCPKTGQKRQIKGCEKACFTAWSKGTAYTIRNLFIAIKRFSAARARIMRPCPRARTRTREKSVSLPVLGKWPANGQRTAKECGQIVVSRPGRPSEPRRGAYTCRCCNSFLRSGWECSLLVVAVVRLRFREASRMKHPIGCID